MCGYGVRSRAPAFPAIEKFASAPIGHAGKFRPDRDLAEKVRTGRLGKTTRPGKTFGDFSSSEQLPSSAAPRWQLEMPKTVARRRCIPSLRIRRR